MLFTVVDRWATPPESRKKGSGVTQADVDHLTGLVHTREAVEGILADWSLPGAHPESAAYEMARTVCRRAERQVVRFVEEGGEVQTEVVAYLNRLSDVIWLFGRMIEVRAGVNARLRDGAGAKWSRAW